MNNFELKNLPHNNDELFQASECNINKLTEKAMSSVLGGQTNNFDQKGSMVVNKNVDFGYLFAEIGSLFK